MSIDFTAYCSGDLDTFNPFGSTAPEEFEVSCLHSVLYKLNKCQNQSRSVCKVTFSPRRTVSEVSLQEYVAFLIC